MDIASRLVEEGRTQKAGLKRESRVSNSIAFMNLKLCVHNLSKIRAKPVRRQLHHDVVRSATPSSSQHSAPSVRIHELI
jgi:hypothetical protein